MKDVGHVERTPPKGGGYILMAAVSGPSPLGVSGSGYTMRGNANRAIAWAWQAG